MLAGDIGAGTLARDFIERDLERSPVIYVSADHEYYGFRPQAVIEADWRKLAGERPALRDFVATSCFSGPVVRSSSGRVGFAMSIKCRCCRNRP